jgi:hypothetical protein
MAAIRPKYVNKFANKDRADKRQRYYFRKRGMKAIPLLGVPGSEEFMQVYAMASRPCLMPGQRSAKRKQHPARSMPCACPTTSHPIERRFRMT